MEQLALDPNQLNARLAGVVADIERTGPGWNDESPELTALGSELLADEVARALLARWD